ncbi:hypothetical protein BKA69DRAFT_1073122, partial [Paraphysoderma sedebokerense]
SKENAPNSRAVQKPKTGTVDELSQKEIVDGIPIAAKFKGPGPAAYDVKKSAHTRYRSPPAFSFGQKIATMDHHKGPAPNSFLPKLSRGPAFSIQGRFHNQQTTDTTSPSPATYDLKPSAIVKTAACRAPAITIAGRTDIDKSINHPSSCIAIASWWIYYLTFAFL